MKLHENQNLNVFLQFNLLNQIAKLYNDDNTNKIIVRNVTCNPFVFTWANNTLPLALCDNKTIFELLDVSFMKNKYIAWFFSWIYFYYLKFILSWN